MSQRLIKYSVNFTYYLQSYMDCKVPEVNGNVRSVDA
jgi:hypothetical protein